MLFIPFFCEKLVHNLACLLRSNTNLKAISVYICLCRCTRHFLKINTLRLKSLEIKGFKSFADKTVLNFDEGVTGIIGPNGCGKSNIIDSIRWVIGEQKISQLRSENLESLVFNGSKSRSASGLAEVSLTFENTRNLLPIEFNTVTVTRKYYKNGDSEYRLNDVSCRLKDIHNLFMDTGISTDSYAIIELGMVDDIIKDKENSRRRMLEQAAGITIYKTRKREAKLKLDAAQHDLARIEDLLFEINNQLKSLENQAKKAEKYYEIKKDYRNISIELTKAALEGFNLTYHDLSDRQNTETDNRIQMEAAIATEEAALEKDKADFVEKEQALHVMQSAFNELTNRLRETRAKENLSAQRLNHLTEKEQNLKEFIAKAQAQLTGIDESIHFTAEQIKEEEAFYQENAGTLESIKNELNEKRNLFDSNRGILDTERQTQMQLQRNRFEVEKNVAIADTSITNLQRSIALLSDEQEQRRQIIHKLEEDKAQKSDELNKAQHELENLKEENEKIKSLILDSQAELEKLRNELMSENRILDAKQNEHDLLKSLVDKMEGYPESVKFLHNNAGWLKDVPLLSDILYVKEDYRAAVENVLETYLNYYVVATEEDAMQAISLLQDHKKGKAKFFILDKLPQNQSAAHVAGDGLTPALDVVEVDENYKTLARHLLGEVVIAENEEVFTSADGIVLEKSGKIVKGNYSIGGGSVGLFEGKKIGRVKNLEKLSSHISSQKEKVSALKNSIDQRSGKVFELNNNLKDRQIQQSQKLVMDLTNALSAIENKVENYSQQQVRSGQRLADLTSQLEKTQSDIEGTRGQLGALLEKASGHDDVVRLAEQAFKEAEEAFNNHNRKFHEFNIQLTRQQSKIHALKQEMEFKSRQVQDLTAQIKNSEEQLGGTTIQLTETRQELDSLKSDLILLMKEKEAEEIKLNDADRAYHVFRNALVEKESKLRQLHKTKEQSDQAVAEIKDKLNELKLQLAGMKERLMVEFKVDIDTVLGEDRETTFTKEELQEKSDRLKKRLENIGEINPTAIEAFTEMKKRYDFINEQKNDLVEARQSLMQTIHEVETTANQKFLETFNRVRENFKTVFQALFTEDDTADMVLEDPENLAETGIDIMAKPKGKRPTSITQLSGGEKTLTATALLFAIYLIKPAPFCILDEVDAPLDDANVQKFTQMIRKFSRDSQFIIVTHNKMTMASVDVIYGVTMQELGVSKLVPVDFRGLEHEYETVEATVA